MHLAKLIVFTAGLTWRHLREDPARARRLALRLALRLAPGGVRARLRRLAVPTPRDPEREAAELRTLLGACSRTTAPLAPYAREGRGPERTGADQDRGRHRPRTVLHLVTNALPDTNAGYTVRTHKIALAQRAAGLDPHVVTRLGYPLAQGIPDARPVRSVDGIPYHRLIPWWPPGGVAGNLRKNADLAADLVERLRPAVLHAASNHLNAAVALDLRSRYDLPVVYEVRGFLEDSWLSRDPGRSAADPYYRLTRELETARMRAADLVITLGEAMRDDIADREVAEERIVVVPNAVDDAYLEPLPDGAALRAELGFAADDVVVGLTSTFYGYEGIDTLIDAVALLRDTPVRLLLVGDGPERHALERRVAELGGDRVVFTGRVPLDQVRRYHAVLDIFAVPRRANRVCQLVTPLKPIEAMAGGLPVVASDVRALREIVEPDVTGTLTLPEDPEAWANTLKPLIYSPDRRRKIGQAGREWVRTERTWRSVTMRYLGAYRRLGID